MSIKFHYQNTQLTLTQKNSIKAFVATIFQKEKKTLQQLDYIFCTDAFLLEINSQFLNHDDYTDIITFDLSEAPSAIIGEIYISIDRVKENAKLFKTNFKQEALRVIFHGALHLCGYKDKTKSEKAMMRAKEEQYLQAFFKKHA